MRKLVKISATEVLGMLHGQSREGQRIPYPIRAIPWRAGIDIEKFDTIPPGAIRCSKEFYEFGIRFDKKELARIKMRQWMVGGWLLNIGPLVDPTLKGLEFTVNTEALGIPERTEAV